MKDVFVLSCVIGARSGIRTTAAKSVDIFDDDVLKSRDWAMLSAISLAEGSDINILDDRNEILRIAQDYANTGARILREKISRREVAQSVAQLLLQ